MESHRDVNLVMKTLENQPSITALLSFSGNIILSVFYRDN